MGDLDEGEYIYRNPTLWVESRASKVSRWTRDDNYPLTHGEISNGELNVNLTGDVARAVKFDSVNKD